MGGMRHVVVALAVGCAVAVTACSGDDGTSSPATSAPATSAPATSAATTTAAATSTTARPTTTAAASTTSTTIVTTTTTGTTTTTRPSTTTTVVCPGPAFARTTSEATVIPATAALLTAVRVAGHDCYDRVVFQFDGPGLPEWRVEPAEPPFSGPSGMPIPVRGTSWLRVRFGTANGHTDDGAATVGNAPVPLADTTVLRQVQLIEDFEAVVVYVIGLDGPRPFRVLTFADPPRVAIDVRTG